MAWKRPSLRTIRDGGHFRRRPDRQPEDLELDGHRFDSLGEKRRYAALKMMALGGLVRDIEVHPRLDMVINGRKIGRGWMELDFRYEEWIDGAWRIVYEDYKDVITREAKLRVQLVEALHNIKVKIVRG